MSSTSSASSAESSSEEYYAHQIDYDQIDPQDIQFAKDVRINKLIGSIAFSSLSLLVLLASSAGLGTLIYFAIPYGSIGAIPMGWWGIKWIVMSPIVIGLSTGFVGTIYPLIAVDLTRYHTQEVAEKILEDLGSMDLEEISKNFPGRKLFYLKEFGLIDKDTFNLLDGEDGGFFFRGHGHIKKLERTKIRLMYSQGVDECDCKFQDRKKAELQAIMEEWTTFRDETYRAEDSSSSSEK